MQARAWSIAAVAAASLATAAAAGAAPPEVGHFSEDTPMGPAVVTDLPCLEGTAFDFTGSEHVRGSFSFSDDRFHFAVTEHHTATLVPVDGDGPTYVESGNADHTSFTTRAVDGGFAVTTTHVNNDRFVAYEDGKVVASATIRIHEVTHLVGVDTDGDDVPDVIKASVTIDDVSCPA